MRIIAADRRANTRLALRLLLESCVEDVLVLEAESAQELLSLARMHKPDFVLLDWQLRHDRTVELITCLRRIHPAIRVIVVSSLPDVRRAALSSGADAFVNKADGPDALLYVLSRFMPLPSPGYLPG